MAEWMMYLMYGLGFTSLAGIVILIVWLIGKQLLTKNGSVDVIYKSLKVTMIIYSFPIAYILLLARYLADTSTRGWFWVESPIIINILSYVFAIWILGAFISVVVFFVKMVLFNLSCEARSYATTTEKSILEEMKKQLGMQGRISLYHSYDVKSPFVKGIFIRSIYLPVEEFDDRELRIVFTHELLHLKHQDLLWKSVFRLVACIFWFHPVTWILLNQFDLWAELYCDYCSVNGTCDTSEYIAVLLKMAKDNPKSVLAFSLGWSRQSKDLKWRIEMMDKMLSKKVKSGIASLVMAGALLISSTSVYAINTGVTNTYSEVCEDTMSYTEESIAEDGMVEYTTTVDQLGDDIIIVDEFVSPIAPMAADGNINWTIPSGGTVKSGGFYGAQGNTEYVSVVITPTGKTCQAGVIYADGTVTYVQGTNAYSHGFVLKMSGTIHVFVRNMSTSTVTVNGGYTR